MAGVGPLASAALPRDLRMQVGGELPVRDDPPNAPNPEWSVSPTFTPAARRLGLVSAFGAAGLEALYVACLAVGLATLPSPDVPIQDPWFTLMELLIVAMMPSMVTLMVALHAWAPPARRAFALAAALFMAAAALLTTALHMAVLLLARRPPYDEMAWLFAFTWPSVVYVLDIVAWDVFFALAALCAAPVFFAGPSGSAPERRIGWLFAVSGGLALAGLAGVVVGDMQVRNIGIVGYAVVFPVAAGLTGVRFVATSAAP